MWQLMWRNVIATTLNAMLQLLVIYRYRYRLLVIMKKFIFLLRVEAKTQIMLEFFLLYLVFFFFKEDFMIFS